MAHLFVARFLLGFCIIFFIAVVPQFSSDITIPVVVLLKADDRIMQSRYIRLHTTLAPTISHAITPLLSNTETILRPPSAI
jgi:hypothetical protein